MSNALAIPTSRELEALTPADRWKLEDQLDECQDVLREFNDDELRRWVEVEGKTQAQIAKLVGRTQGRISQRCSALGIVSGRTSSGQQRSSISPNTPPDIEADLEPAPRTKARQSRYAPEGPAHYFPDVVAEDALENLRTQVLHWFEQGQVVRDLLNGRKPLEPRSDEDRNAIKREAVVMERLARRIKEVTDA